MLTPTNFIVFLLVLSILDTVYHIAKYDDITKDTRTHGDKAVLAIAGTIVMFLNPLVVWLVWNHVVVKEFAVPMISYVSAFFIAMAIRWCAHPLRENR